MNHLSTASSAAVSSLLAWTPFLQPAPAVDRWWWFLLVPLSLGVALSYKATRVRDLRTLPRDAVVLAAQIVGGMIGLALALFLLVQVLLPLLPAE
ncbi:MAG: hypothetical protein QM516_00030 [Limnohabitans sp.]|nr:hypothetical protein [Limnohabitans sp.]